MSKAEISRSRSTRKIVLDMLRIVADGGGEFGLSFQQLIQGFIRSRRGMTDGELRGELADLVGDRLVGKKWDEGMGDDYYAITSRGRDFTRAGCPWEKVDEFTGSQP